MFSSFLLLLAVLYFCESSHRSIGKEYFIRKEYFIEKEYFDVSPGCQRSFDTSWCFELEEAGQAGGGGFDV